MTPEQRAETIQTICIDVLNEGGATKLGMMALDLVRGNVPEDREMVSAAVILGDVTATALATAVCHMRPDQRQEALQTFLRGILQRAESTLNEIDKMVGKR